CSPPPDAAYSHSASVGRRPPSQAQNANASYQLTQFIGMRSFVPAGFQVAESVAQSKGKIAPMEAFHADCHPLFEISGCRPAPLVGGAVYAPANFRNRPTDTSNLSSENVAIDAVVDLCTPIMKAPPGTTAVEQQSSLEANPQVAGRSLQLGNVQV